MMNRKCRRNHQNFWRTKLLSNDRRLVQCTKCGGVEQEWKVKPVTEKPIKVAVEPVTVV